MTSTSSDAFIGGVFADRMGRTIRKPAGVSILKRESVYAVCVQGGEVLLVQPTLGTWWELPGGAIDAGESHEQALAREVWEETGLTAYAPFILIGTKTANFYADDLDQYFHATLHFYGATITSPSDELHPQDQNEIQQARWEPLSSLDFKLIGRAAHRWAIQHYLGLPA